jgi:CP family cyanate transporter-like MFS transporter
VRPEGGQQLTASGPALTAYRQFWVSLALLWLAGVALRLTVLVIPPIIPLIASDLSLSGTEIGILSGIPVILLGAAAMPGSALIARFGALRTLLADLLIAGLASALRGVAAGALALYAATAVMSAGIAIMQPALPPLARQWLPARISLASAVFTNGLLVGETIPVMVTVPLVLPVVHGSWRAALVVWSLPMLVIAALLLAFAPRSGQGETATHQARWRPNWRSGAIWQLGTLFGSANSVYFCTNAFLPGYLTGVGRSDLIAITLTALNLGQLPASIAMVAISARIERRAFPFVAAGIMMLICLAGIVSTASGWTVFFAAWLGFLGAVVLTLGFALPPLLSKPADVAHTSAAMFTISYSEGLIVSVLSGAAWDLAGNARFAFLPIAMAALPLLFVPALLGLHRRR